jgi:ribosomal protein S12 methylthiotransferase
MVDLEYAIGEILKYSDRAAIDYIEDPEAPEADYVLVNTCGFLSSARQESEETLAYYDSLGKKLILMGCYVSVKDDAFLAGLRNLVSIVPFMSYSVIEELVLGKKSKFNLSAIVKAKQAHKESKEKTLANYLASIEAPGKNKKAFVWRGDEVRAYMHAPFGYEYLKVAEWCDNNCTFCIIPTIRGRQTSRPIESIIEEVKVMLSQGIREIQILSQDTTRYGTDIYGEPRLMELLRAVDETISAFISSRHPEWNEGSRNLDSSQAQNDETKETPKFRVYYLYPDILTLSHIDELAKLKHFLPYFDIPFQHASERILKLMGRHYDRAHIDAFLDKIRVTKWPYFENLNSFVIPSEAEESLSKLPYENDSVSSSNVKEKEMPTAWQNRAFIRTAFIIGFPWETDQDFEVLKDFVRRYEFESVGIFQYHDEPLATSSKLSNKVSENIAKVRISELTPILEGIYEEKKNERRKEKQVGYIMEIWEKTVIIRPELHAPEVDEYDKVDIKNIDGIPEIGRKIHYTM